MRPTIDEQLSADRARDIQQIGNETRLRDRALVDRSESLRADPELGRLVAKDLLPQQHRGHRCSKLVRDRREELILQATSLLRIGARRVSLCEQLRALVFGRVLLAVFGRRAEPAPEQIHREPHAMPPVRSVFAANSHLDIRRHALAARFLKCVETAREILGMDDELPVVVLRAAVGEPRATRPQRSTRDRRTPHERGRGDLEVACDHLIGDRRADHDDGLGDAKARPQGQRTEARGGHQAERHLGEVTQLGGRTHGGDGVVQRLRHGARLEQSPPRCVRMRCLAGDGLEHRGRQRSFFPQCERLCSQPRFVLCGRRSADRAIEQHVRMGRRAFELSLELVIAHVVSPP